MLVILHQFPLLRCYAPSSPILLLSIIYFLNIHKIKVLRFGQLPLLKYIAPKSPIILKSKNKAFNT